MFTIFIILSLFFILFSFRQACLPLFGGAAGTCTPVLRRFNELSTYLVYLLIFPHISPIDGLYVGANRKMFFKNTVRFLKNYPFKIAPQSTQRNDWYDGQLII